MFGKLRLKTIHNERGRENGTLKFYNRLLDGATQLKIVYFESKRTMTHCKFKCWKAYEVFDSARCLSVYLENVASF